jgi:hypothetical protein
MDAPDMRVARLEVGAEPTLVTESEVKGHFDDWAQGYMPVGSLMLNHAACVALCGLLSRAAANPLTASQAVDAIFVIKHAYRTKILDDQYLSGGEHLPGAALMAFVAAAKPAPADPTGIPSSEGLPEGVLAR